MSFDTRSMMVVDEAHIATGKTLQEMCLLLDQGITLYIKALDDVTNEAAKKGITTERYQEYRSIVSGLKGQLERAGTVLNTTATDFVTAIDKADSYLY